MADRGLAVHRTIVVVDVEGFGDRGRTDRHQLAVRDGLYRAVQEAFSHAGIAWTECDHEDRGDGVLILAPAGVPKGLFVESLPSALAAALRAHNDAHPAQERIRLRMALHAGEVRYDDYGVTATSVNVAFRLLDASELKAALAGSRGVLAVITSSWFFEEVVRHSAADSAAYRRVLVEVKESRTSGWICLPDQVHSSGDAGPETLPPARTVPDRRPPAWGAVLARKIWGGVPARNPGFRGRDELLQAVRGALAAGDRAVVQALHGIGGVGKTQIAIEYTHRFAADYDLVWWANSERPELIAEQFAALAGELDCTSADASLAVVQRAVLSALHERDRWLLVFDNAERPDHVAPWLPGGTGHVLITSRAYGWDDLAVPVSVSVFSRAESRTILQSRVMGLTAAGADLVGAAVGDLPLAVGQAAGYMAYTGIPAEEYVSLLTERPAEMLELGRPYSYPRSLAAATRLSWDQMQAEDPVTAEAVGICAFLAPEPIPAEWLPNAADKLPGMLRRQAQDPVAWRQVIARLRGSGLVRVDPDGLVMHRLTQAVIRDLLSGSASPVPSLAEATVVANVPSSTLPVTWRAWAYLLPHLMALDPGASASGQLRDAAATAACYLVERGDGAGACAVAGDLFSAWRERLGEDDRVTLRVGNSLARALAILGRYADARALDEYILDHRRAAYGKDDLETLTTASNLANRLRQLEDYPAARELDEDTFARSRRVLGDDHVETLRSASNLAEDLIWLGELDAARELQEATLEKIRRRFGADHPETLRSASNLAKIFRGLGNFAVARQLDKDTLERRRRLLGTDHPITFNSASYLAADLRELRELQSARQLDEDTLTRRRRVLGENHPNTRESVDNLAEDLRLLGEC